jgi:hypothetical protein
MKLKILVPAIVAMLALTFGGGWMANRMLTGSQPVSLSANNSVKSPATSPAMSADPAPQDIATLPPAPQPTSAPNPQLIFSCDLTGYSGEYTDPASVSYIITIINPETSIVTLTSLTALFMDDGGNVLGQITKTDDSVIPFDGLQIAPESHILLTFPNDGLYQSVSGTPVSCGSITWDGQYYN